MPKSQVCIPDFLLRPPVSHSYSPDGRRLRRANAVRQGCSTVDGAWNAATLPGLLIGPLQYCSRPMFGQGHVTLFRTGEWGVVFPGIPNKHRAQDSCLGFLAQRTDLSDPAGMRGRQLLWDLISSPILTPLFLEVTCLLTVSTVITCSVSCIGRNFFAPLVLRVPMLGSQSLFFLSVKCLTLLHSSLGVEFFSPSNYLTNVSVLLCAKH